MKEQTNLSGRSGETRRHTTLPGTEQSACSSETKYYRMHKWDEIIIQFISSYKYSRLAMVVASLGDLY